MINAKNSYGIRSCGRMAFITKKGRQSAMELGEVADLLNNMEKENDGLLEMYCGYIWLSKFYEDDINRLEKGLPRLTKDEFKKNWPVSNKWEEVEAEFIARKLSEFKERGSEKQATTAAEPSESKEPEILSWREAAVLWGQGIDIQRSGRWGIWEDVPTSECGAFYEERKYRRKPVPPQPDYSLDQGFKEGDIVMVKSLHFESVWHPIPYEEFRDGKHYSQWSSWAYARPLTRDEYKKVRVME